MPLYTECTLSVVAWTPCMWNVDDLLRALTHTHTYTHTVKHENRHTQKKNIVKNHDENKSGTTNNSINLCFSLCLSVNKRLHSWNEKILIYGNQTGTKLNGKFSSSFQQQLKLPATKFICELTGCGCTNNSIIQNVLLHVIAFTVVVIQFACTHAHIAFGCLSVRACPNHTIG